MKQVGFTEPGGAEIMGFRQGAAPADVAATGIVDRAYVDGCVTADRRIGE